MGTLFLAVAIVAEVTATTALRFTAGENPRWWSWIIVVVAYLVSFAALQRCLASGFPLGIAYAIWCGVGVIAVALLSFFLFREGLTTVQIVGIVLIIAGVGCLELGRAPSPDGSGVVPVIAAAGPAADPAESGRLPRPGHPSTGHPAGHPSEGEGNS